MADERRKIRDRSRDIEALAVSLFVTLYPANRGQKNPGFVADESLSAAREFYRVLDTDPEPIAKV